MRIILFGSTGWIGRQLKDTLGPDYVTTAIRMESNLAHKMISAIRPTHVVCCAGLSESENKTDLVRTNVLGVLNILNICQKSNIHFTYIGVAWQDGSFHSKTKWIVQDLMKEYTNCLVLRLVMPVTMDLDDPKNCLNKLMNRDKVTSYNISMSVLPTLFPYVFHMIQQKLNGTYNLMNPGKICHHDVLKLIKQYRKPDIKWRSIPQFNHYDDCVFNTDDLLKLYPDIPDVKTALRLVLELKS